MTRPDSPIPYPQRPTLAWLAIGVVACALLYFLAPVLMPFVLAGVLGYMLNPGVDWLAKHRVPRWLGTALMILLLFTIIVILILIILPVLQKEFLQVRDRLPDLMTRLQTVVAPRLSSWFGVDVEFNSQAIRQYATEHFALEGIATSMLGYLKIGAASAFSWLTTAFLVPFVLFYLLVDWHMIWARLDHLIPREPQARIHAIAAEVDAVLAQFLRGQLLVMVILAVYYSVALSVAHFEIALPVGILSGLLVFIPYAGFATGLALALLAAMLQFGNLYGFVAVAVIYGVGQVLESVILTPRIVGENIGLHPIAVIFALLAFGEIFGFFGILLALPVSAVLVVGLKHVLRHYRDSELYRGEHAVLHARRAVLEGSDTKARGSKANDGA